MQYNAGYNPRSIFTDESLVPKDSPAMPDPGQELTAEELEDAGSFDASASIEAVEKAIKTLSNLDEEIYKTDKKLSGLKKTKDYILKTYIPHQLNNMGVTEITTNSGNKVTIGEQIYVVIKNKKQFLDYINSIGADHMLDTTLRIKKLSTSAKETIVDMVTGLGAIIANIDYGMHHSTQRKFFKAQLQDNTEEQKIVSKFGDVRTYWETKIKEVF